MDTVLGNTYEDSVAGTIGVAIAKVSFLFGSPQTALVPPVNMSNEEPKTIWFDDDRLVEPTGS